MFKIGADALLGPRCRESQRQVDVAHSSAWLQILNPTVNFTVSRLSTQYFTIWDEGFSRAGGATTRERLEAHVINPHFTDIDLTCDLEFED